MPVVKSSEVPYKRQEGSDWGYRINIQEQCLYKCMHKYMLTDTDFFKTMQLSLSSFFLSKS